MSDNKLSIVFSTRSISNGYVKHIEKTCGYDNVLEVLPYENNGEYSLTEIYNMGLKAAKGDIIVFCHDDLIFETPEWGKKLLQHFNNNPEYGIIGIAGSNHLVDGKWWSLRESMHGIVNHTDGFRKWTSMFSRPQDGIVKEMVVLDGLFFAVNKAKIKHEFDTVFSGFHFYDISFCLQNHLSGVKIGLTTDIILTHLSVGQTNQKWEDNKKLFEDKYSNKLPVKI